MAQGVLTGPILLHVVGWDGGMCTVVNGEVQDASSPEAREAVELILSGPVRVWYSDPSNAGDSARILSPEDPGFQRAALEALPGAIVEGD